MAETRDVPAAAEPALKPWAVWKRTAPVKSGEGLSCSECGAGAYITVAGLCHICLVFVKDPRRGSSDKRQAQGIHAPSHRGAAMPAGEHAGHPLNRIA